ncbi:MAG: hypothetical protein HRU20_20875 [Pseudomonadales bacterium]|nr:hypothetical protein [Pseudomonadales bacterium]
MSEKNVLNDNVEMLNANLQNIWHASLGVFGKVGEQGQKQFEQLSQSYQEKIEALEKKVDKENLFDNLVEKGLEVEVDTQKSYTSTKEKAQKQWQEKLKQLKAVLSMDEKKAFNTEEMSKKMDDIINMLGLKSSNALVSIEKTTRA